MSERESERERERERKKERGREGERESLRGRVEVSLNVSQVNWREGDYKRHSEVTCTHTQIAHSTH